MNDIGEWLVKHIFEQVFHNWSAVVTIIPLTLLVMYFLAMLFILEKKRQVNASLGKPNLKDL